MAGMRFLVSGHVQGVGFRAATRVEALRLGIHGHARNLRDGRVEVIAIADEAAIAQLATWLQHGPSSARVNAVVRELTEDGEMPHGFFIR